MADYTWVRGLTSQRTGIPTIQQMNNLGLEVIMPFSWEDCEDALLALAKNGIKIIPKWSQLPEISAAYEQKYNIIAYFIDDEPEFHFQPQEIIDRVNGLRARTSLPICCNFTSAFWMNEPWMVGRWGDHYPEVFAVLDMVCIDSYFHREGGLYERELGFCIEALKRTKAEGKSIIGIAQGHESTVHGTTTPDIPYVDNFWRSNGCGVLWYAWNEGEASVGSRAGDAWYNQEIAKVNEGVVPTYPCPYCPATFTNQPELDAHIAKEHPGNGEKPGVFYSQAAYDGHIALVSDVSAGVDTGATYCSLQRMLENSIGKRRSFLSFDTSGIPDDAIIDSAYIRVNAYAGWGSAVGVCNIDYLLYGGLSPDDYNRTPNAANIATININGLGWKQSGTFRNVNKTGRSQYRVRTNEDGTYSANRFYSGNSPSNKPELYVIYHIPFIEEITTKTIVHTCNALIEYKVSSFPGNNNALTCPHCGLALGVEGIKETEQIKETPTLDFPCPHCPATFTSQAELDAHIAKEHPTNGEIDIGGPAEDMVNLSSANETSICKENPANASGLITQAQIYQGVAGNVIFGIFYVISGNTLKCRSIHNVGWCGTGLTTKTVSMAVQAGDYIGAWSSGQKDYSDSGGSVGFWYLNGDQCTVGNQQTFNPTSSSRLLAVYGKGSVEIIEEPEIITPHIVICQGCGSRLELSISSIASKNIQQYCPVCGEPAD